MALVDDIATRLVAQGVGTLGTDLFTGILPEAPDACVAVQEYAGSQPGRGFGPHGTAPLYEDARVQVLARAATYEAARTKAGQAVAALDWLQDVTLNGVRYFAVEALQRPAFPLTRDANDRFVFATNLAVRRAASTT